MKQRKRAPKGYRIQLWADGFYHVYHGPTCLAETLLSQEAMRVAIEHVARANAYEYFMNESDIRWFEKPERPAPPIYKRLKGTDSMPVSDSPIGEITPPGNITLLTQEQVTVWYRI